MTKIVTRFAPSPTGYLHIGGARTALFNWLFTQHMREQGHDATCLLRIEDTDRARSTEDAVEAIFEGLNWLELKFDGEPVFQFARMNRHAEVAHELIKKGEAYYCTCTPADLDKMREEQKAKGLPLGYDGRCRDKGNASGAVRIKAPKTTPEHDVMVVQDVVQGNVSVALTQLDDMILLRSDGTPTYMLSVVVDDYDMGVTHVIRGDDHLNNAFRQNMIYYAMNWTPPIYAHIPLILGPDGAKLSKRHGAVGLHVYKDMGYLPEAMRNYLLRLGWGHGDTDIVSTAEAIKLFTLEGIGRSPSRMDFAKLAHVNAHYLKLADDDRVMTLLTPFIEKEIGDKANELGLARVKKALTALKERAQTLIELAQAGLFFMRQRPLPLTDDAAKVLDQPTRALIGELRGILDTVVDFKHDKIESALKDYAATKDLKLGKVAMPLRAAITGTTNSPSVFQVAEILGKEETLARLSDVA